MQNYQDLVDAFNGAPEPSFKVTNYFEIYTELFSHLRGAKVTFIETGVFNGGSLFMWKKWLCKNARIIGVDLNPAAAKWRNFGFEIFIGDQGDPQFWSGVFKEIGEFDALLDDGGHQSFQQIVTLTEAIKHAKSECIIAIEDTCTSFMREFSSHLNHSFLEYAKDSTDSLLVKTNKFFPGEFPEIENTEIVDLFKNIYSINFYSGIVAYKIKSQAAIRPSLVWNNLPAPSESETDFRYAGANEAEVIWPDLFAKNMVTVSGKK